MAKLIEITGKALAGEWGTDDESGEGIPVLRTTNFTNEGTVDYNNVVTRTIIKKNLEEKYLRAGDIIIEKSGGSDKQPVGRVVYFDGPENTYLFNNFTGLLRVKEQTKWFPKYVFYSLYGNYRRGGTRPFENKTTGLHNLKTDGYVSRYEVAETSFSKQVEISSQLDKLHSIIKMREDEVIKLDDLIRARFVEMFDLSNCAYKSLGECTDFVDYRGHTPELSDEGTIRMINAKSVGKGFFKYVDEFITEKTYESWMHRGFGYPGDILFVTEGHTFGNTCLIPKDMTKFALGQRVITIKGRDEIENAFLCSYMQTDMFWKDINVYRTGGTAQGIRSKDLIKVMVPIPPIEQQKDFVKFVNQVDKSKFDGMAWQRWLFSVGMKSAGGNNPCGAKEQDKDEFGRKK